MRIAYCTNVRLPNERAHGHQVSAVCAALQNLGHEVHIFAPYRHNPHTQDFWDFHHANRSIELTSIGRTDYIRSMWTPGVVGLWTMNAMLRRRLPSTLTGFDLLYTRTPALLSALIRTGIPVVLELHTLPNRGRTAFVRACNACARVSCLTSPIKAELLEWGVREDIMIVEGDAVDASFLKPLADMVSAKQSFGIDPETFIIGYAGSLVTMGLSKGADQIVKAVSLIDRSDLTALIAGGPDSAAEELRSHNDQAVILGHILRDDVRKLYAASDILVYPAPYSHHPYFVRDTSPLKIFEYMASGKPIICADIPPIADVLDQNSARFYTPGDINDLVDQIHWILNHPSEAKSMADTARKRGEECTWERRMERIMRGL